MLINRNCGLKKEFLEFPYQTRLQIQISWVLVGARPLSSEVNPHFQALCVLVTALAWPVPEPSSRVHLQVLQPGLVQPASTPSSQYWLVLW